MRPPAAQPRRPAIVILALLLAISLVGVACDAGVPRTAVPAASGPTPAANGAAPSATPATSVKPSGVPSPTPVVAPDARLTGLTPGALAVTVSDGLRVRSEPGVSAASLKYTPLLPIGTPLVVAAGPVRASGYDWFRVAPVGMKLSGGADQGWVAVADHDGTPWVALADDPTPGFELAAASLERPDPSLADAKAQAKAFNALGIDLYRELLEDPAIVPPGKGIVFSPTSIATALAMARAGAAGKTAAEMDTVLRAEGWKPLAAGLNSLDALLRSRDAAWTSPSETGDRDTHRLALRTANMAFGQDGYPIEEAYIERLGRTFGSGFGLVDYIRHTDEARQAINGWVSRQTMARIPELLGPRDLRDTTRLALVNAIYLKAEWLLPFTKELTADRTFTTLDGTTVTVPMMKLGWLTYEQQQSVPYMRGEGFRATELLYTGPDGTTPLAMTLILPDDLAAFEQTMTASSLAKVAARMKRERQRLGTVTYSAPPDVEMDCGTYPYALTVLLPRFGIDTRGDLVSSLQALGMTRATDPQLADFSGITDPTSLWIAKVIHQANIDVDEEGTEAAAATVVLFDTTGGCGGPAPRKEITLRFDKPFLFVVRDLQTGANLFMGRVTDPSQR